MFYYYGAKNTLAKYYPSPNYNLIIEPFAGSAAYSCFHLKNNKKLECILVEKDKRVYDMWTYCLSATEKDIDNYPIPAINEQTSDYLIMTCTVSNATSKCKSMKFTPRLARVFDIQKRKIKKLLSIKDRVTVINQDYREVSNFDFEATWFIDPPYQITTFSKSIFQNGDGYSKECNATNTDFTYLADFCKSRNGQVIVCEKSGANWLDFKEFKTNKTGLNKIYKEVIWTK